MIAFTFPGQGAQRPGFGRAWTDHPSWELVAEASEIAGRDVARLLVDADAEELRATRNAQLSTFVASLVVLDAVERLGIAPHRTAGHSLGEYTALTAAGVLAFDEGVRLVVERGDAMQAAADEREGTMRAVLGLDDEQMAVACARVAGEVWPANFNAPGHTVIAGSPGAVAEACSVARDLGATKVLDVPVGGAFHTPLMASARSRLHKALAGAEWRTPDTPVVANVDAMVHTGSADWHNLLSAQLCSPVRWRQSVATLVDHGVRTFLELGPGSHLTSLARRNARDGRAIAVSRPDDLDGLLEALSGVHPESPLVGEHLYVAERLVVTPVAGVFRRSAALGEGSVLEAGMTLGDVSGQPVCSAFAGRLMGYLALDGERVTPSQPVAWLIAGDG